MPKARHVKKLDLVHTDLYVHPWLSSKASVNIKYSGPKRLQVAAVEKLMRKKCPISLPVTVRMCDLSSEKLCGRCLVFADKAGNLKRFEIEIDPRLPEPSVIDSLIHEWAHAMDYDRNGLSRKRHRKSWGICFAEAWDHYDRADTI